MGERVCENKMVTDGLHNRIACNSSSLFTAGEGWEAGAKFSATHGCLQSLKVHRAMHNNITASPKIFLRKFLRGSKGCFFQKASLGASLSHPYFFLILNIRRKKGARKEGERTTTIFIRRHLRKVKNGG